jgi:anthranilate phosphoribosyltransferase
LIERLGFKLPLDEARAAACLAATGFTFLFAPYFHPAMRALGPIRAALGVRTVFNLLGPLTNPAAPRFQLIGAYDAAAAELLADAVAGMPLQRAWVIHGAGGWDEATPMGPFLAFDVTPDGIVRHEIDPRDLGLAPCAAADLAGADAAANLAALLEVFDCRDRGPHRDALVLQCGLALHIAGRAASIADGIATAGAVLDSGDAGQWLGRLRAVAAAQASERVRAGASLRSGA